MRMKAYNIFLHRQFCYLFLLCESTNELRIYLRKKKVKLEEKISGIKIFSK